ncbi:NAD(P)-binding domain-containing protein [Streptomyces marincola]|uniref:NAD(P)-binding domain-containing protein n=1 Tax=Streptomyces marincola TaxID=2878388 RepID=UPI001CF42FFD|nr:NAD(P)-binding domain-containing protein [Streptomyces marincola]UCM89062.1 lysine N(6)-hydroxylase/L-ornithine N(5)-oxygenase family protein [Streptomyces marincola]
MHDLVVVGAGPYGLSIAAHAAAAGLDVRVLGRPMSAWRDHMPPGMFLKSEPWASNLSEPAGTDTLAAYCAGRGLRAEHGSPLPIGTFTAYGMWFADRLPLPVEDRAVTAVRPWADGFRVETGDDLPPLPARCVALAAGVLPFASVPAPLASLPPGLVSHSSDHGDLSGFAGRDVAVIGAGQAALETAVLLAEAGARPTVVARAPALNWNTTPQPLRRGVRAVLSAPFRAPHSGLGTGWSSWAWSELPWAVRHLPAGVRAHVAATALGPAGAWWLRERFDGAVPVRLGHRLTRAEATPDGRVRIEVATPEGRDAVTAAHVIAATGFEPDLRRLRLLDPAPRDRLRTVRGTRAPALDGGFESSWPGLFFAGLLTAPVFGPAMRFVHGVSFTARALTRGVERRIGAGHGPRVPAPGRAPARAAARARRSAVARAVE